MERNFGARTIPLAFPVITEHYVRLEKTLFDEPALFPDCEAL